MKLGRILKETRIKRGITLSEVARELLMQEEYIQAIEDDLDGILPSGTYKRIYTRTYCKYLGVEFKEDDSQPSIQKKVHGNGSGSNSESTSGKVVGGTEEEIELDFNLDFSRYDINRIFRVSSKLIGLVIVIWVIVKVVKIIFQ